MTRSPLYPRLALAAHIMLGLALIWEVIAGDPVGALTIAVFTVLSFAYLLRDEKLPTGTQKRSAIIGRIRPVNTLPVPASRSTLSHLSVPSRALSSFPLRLGGP